MSEIGIGSVVFVFDNNHRNYRKNAEDRAFGGPIYRDHWVPVEIVSENRVSWDLGKRYGKFRKKPYADGVYRTNADTYGTHKVAVTPQAVDDDCWLHDHAPRVADAVRNCGDAALLRQVAALVGYKEKL